MSHTNNLIGQVFGKLTVTSQAPSTISGRARWFCLCECGKIGRVIGKDLLNGNTKSCGCATTEARHRRKGEGHPLWNGGRKLNSGYVYLLKPTHPNADVKGYVAEHIYVMSQIIGRPLEKNETVHHKNGVKIDNNPSNLELWASRHPRGQRIPDLIAFAKEILAKYEPIIEKL